VKKVVLDFEKAAWKSVRILLPQVVLQGCSFHFKQALMKHIKSEGLIRDYNHDWASGQILKKCMNLCYIPAGSIRRQFENLEKECTTGNYTLIFINNLLHLFWVPYLKTHHYFLY
jgi:hypothetical protein